MGLQGFGHRLGQGLEGLGGLFREEEQGELVEALGVGGGAVLKKKGVGGGTSSRRSLAPWSSRGREALGSKEASLGCQR